MQQRKIIDIVKRYTDSLKNYGFSLDAVYVFGSQIKGTMKKWSDIDVAVVSPFLRENNEEKRFMLWKLRRDIDLRIEPHAFMPEDWSNDSDPMVYEIKKTGLRVV
ncbi:MAG: nucleotidyltransferase domain-containing protein [Candidatus Taylorbacteria bacterium]|nr:nucleotidyltransferase domain-containing protein [Candidatus Taylorbacteria bacterium]